MDQLIRRRRLQSVLTEDLEEGLLEALRSGLPQDRCADAVGVDRDTLKEWLDNSKTRGCPEPFRTFGFRWRQIEAAMLSSIMSAYGRAAQSDWKAADSFLRLRFDEFNPEKQNLLALKPTSHAEDMEQFRQVLENPDEFGLQDEFAKHYVTVGQANKLKEELDRVKKELEAAKVEKKPKAPPKVRKR